MAMHNPPHPGEFISSVYLEPNDISGRELAATLGVATSTLSRILKGSSAVSPEMALRLSKALGRTPESWLAMQYQYDLWRAYPDLFCQRAQPPPPVDFLLRPDRGIAAAQAFFRKALSRYLPRWPRKITLDGLKQSHLALRLLRREDPRWKFVQVRSSQYLNNLIEQDHRARKRRCASMGGFKSFTSAAITLAGIELAHRIRKRQFSLGRGRYRNFGSLKQLWDRALA